MANLEPEQSSYDLGEIARQARSELLEKAMDTAFLRCVDISTDSVDLACRIVLRYFEDKLKATAEHSVKDRLIDEVDQLLNKAVNSLCDDVIRDEELTRLDKKGYLLFRNLVELSEIRNGSGLYARDYLSRIEEEHKNLRDYWVGVVQSFGELTAWKDNDQRIGILPKIIEHIGMIFESWNRRQDFEAEIQGLHALVNEYKRNIPAIIMKMLTVGPDEVAKVASIDTGVPATWLLNSFQPPLDDLRDRLARRVVGQDHVIEKITSVISRRHERGSSPLGSFLLLPGFTLGVRELGESLAEELFGGNDWFAWFNLSKYVDHSSVNDEEDRRRHDVFCRSAVKLLTSKPFRVFMIENVDEYKYADELLDIMLKKGKLTDAEGNSCELSNTVIILTSSTALDAFKALSLKSREIDCPKNPDMVPPRQMLLETFRIVSERVDEMLVLNDVSPVDHDLITRLWTNEIIDSSWESRRLILYPSEAFVNFMATSAKAARRFSMRAWFKNTITPQFIYKELDGVSADMAAICRIDVLVRTNKLSCELLEIDERLNSAWKAFQSTLDPWKSAYQIEKSAAEAILDLRLVQTHLPSVSKGTNQAAYLVMTDLEKLQDCLDRIISCVINSMNLECGQLSVSFFVNADLIVFLNEIYNKNLKLVIRELDSS